MFTAVSLNLILLICAGGIGRSIFRHSKWSSERFACPNPVQVGFGYTVIFLLYDLLLLGRLITRFNGLMLLAVLILVFSNDCFEISRTSASRIKDLFNAKHRGSHKILIWGSLIFFVFGLIGLLAPSTGFDSTVYHLTLPKLYAGANGFVPRPDMIHSSVPQLISGVHTFLYGWGGENAVEFLNLIACFLLSWSLVEIVVMLGVRERHRIWAIVLLCSSLQFMFYLYDAEVEGWLAYLYLCCFCSLYLFDNETRGISLVYLGLIGGFLIGLKITAVPAVCLTLLIYYKRFIKVNKTVSFLEIGSGILLFLLLSFLWHLNIHFFYGELYAGHDLVLGQKTLSIQKFDLEYLYTTSKTILIYNFPIILFFILIIKSYRSQAGRDIFFISIFSMIIIFIINPASPAYVRYTFYVFPLLILGIVLSLQEIGSAGSNFLKRSVMIVIVLSFASANITNLYRNIRKAPVVFGYQTVSEYLCSRVNTYKAIEQANSTIPAQGKLFMIGQRSYWLDVPYVIGIPRNNPSISYNEMTPEKFFGMLENYKITHFLFSDEKSDYTLNFINFWSSYPDLKNDRRIELLNHHVSQSSSGTRNTYFYRLLYYTGHGA